MKNIIICGAAGLVGCGVLDYVAQHNLNMELWAADINIDRIKIYESEKIHLILNEEVESILVQNQMDIMLQMAFPRNVKPEQWAEGIRFAANMLMLAKKYDVKSVINISSQSIYGLNRSESADEQASISLNSPYTTGKYCMELMMEQLFGDRPYTNIRLSTVIGPSTHERVVNKFLAAIMAGDDIQIKGGGQVFSFLDVRDAAAGLITLLMSDANKWHHIYNLGSAEHIGIVDLAEKCQSAAERHGFLKTKVVVEQNEEVVLNSLVKVDSFYEDFGRKAENTIDDSIENIITSMIND